jgi:hypothetical protein
MPTDVPRLLAADPTHRAVSPRVALLPFNEFLRACDATPATIILGHPT